MTELSHGDIVYAVIGGSEIVRGKVLKEEGMSAFNVEVDEDVYGGFAEGDKGVKWAHERDELIFRDKSKSFYILDF